MRKCIGVCAVLLAAFLVLSVAGCAKKGGSSATTGSAGSPGGESKTAAVLRDIREKQAGITSYVLVMGGGPSLTKIKMKLQDGKLIRMRTESNNNGSWVLVQKDKGVEYDYDGSTGTATMMQIDDQSLTMGNFMATGFDWMSRPGIETQIKNVETMNMNGVECWYFPGGDIGTSIWVDKKTGLTVQTENGQMVSEYKYEQINAVPSSEFELPAGVKVSSQPVPAMPQ